MFIQSNMACVSPDKKAEDDWLIGQGMVSLYNYFDEEMRSESVVYVDEQGTISYTNNHIKSGKHMYAILPSGKLCIADCTVHSQINAGKPVQSAGHLLLTDDRKITEIDNCSGHYSPSVSQFLSSVYMLFEHGILQEQVTIVLNPHTKNDYKIDINFFDTLIRNGTSTVSYDKTNASLHFYSNHLDNEAVISVRKHTLLYGYFNSNSALIDMDLLTPSSLKRASSYPDLVSIDLDLLSPESEIKEATRRPSLDCDSPFKPFKLSFFKPISRSPDTETAGSPASRQLHYACV